MISAYSASNAAVDRSYIYKYSFSVVENLPASFSFMNVSSYKPSSHKPSEKHLWFSVDEEASYPSRNPHN